MSEIVCPACEAKYRVPENAIGPEGRRVHCSKCGEIWLARPVVTPVAEPEVSGPPRAIEAPAPAAQQDQVSDGPEVAADRASPETTARQESEEPAQAMSGNDPAAAENDHTRDEPAAAASAEAEPQEETAAGDDTVRPETPAAEEKIPAWKRAFAAELGKSADGPAEPADEPATAAEATEESAWAEEPAPPAPAADVAAETVGADEPEAEKERTAGEAAPPAAAGREEQMAEIRRMLDELQAPRSHEDAETSAASQAGPVPVPPAVRPAEASRKPASEEPQDRYHDPLREKLLQHDKKAGGADARKNYDHRKLMKKHVRRNRRRALAEQQRNSSGAFLTGFTLTACVAATIMLVYAFDEEIVARVPGSGPAMQEYVATIDSLRGVAGEQYAVLRAKVETIIEESL